MSDGAMILLSWLIVTAVVAGSILGGATSASPDYDVEDLVDYNAAEWAHIADVHPAEANSAGNKTDPGCILIPADLMHYYCGSQEFKVMNELLMEVVCNSGPLDCSQLPRDRFPGLRLDRLEVTRCLLPPGLDLTCVGGTSKTLYLDQWTGSLSESNVRALDVEDLIINCRSGKVREIPMDAIRALPRLKKFSILAGTSIPLPKFPPVPLEYLEVSISGVTSLPAGVFSELNNLTTLSLFLNNINDVHVDALQGLNSLAMLDLNNNPLATLPVGVFKHTPRLRSLYLERVSLSHLPAGVLGGLEYLQQVNLSSNMLLSVESLALSGLRSLTALSVRYTNLTSLPLQLFNDTTLLVKLTLCNNQLETIEEGLFSPLSSLQLLDLSNNRLESFAGATFRRLAALKRLDLTGNRLSSLPDMMFSGLKLLSSVSFAHNNIKEIPSASFISADSLEHLFLSHNSLSWALSPIDYADDWYIGESSPLNMLCNLKTLDLSFNNISVVYSDWRLVMRKLSTLNLSHNALTELAQADMQFLGFDSALPTKVDFSYNHITSVQPRHPGITAGSTALVTLGDNPFDCDCNLYDFITKVQNGAPQYSAAGAKCALPPSLAGRPLALVPVYDVTCPVLNVPESCTCLIRPHCARVECTCDELIKLPNISETGFSQMSVRLRRLVDEPVFLPPFVNNLTLTHLNLTDIPYLPTTVTYLDISNNLIETVPIYVLERNLTLKLASNPIACDCFSSENVKLLQKYSFKIDYDEATCSDGTLVKQKDVTVLCDVYKSYISGSLVAVIVISTAVIIALFYIYRVEVQVLLYRWGWCMFFLPKEDADADKKYDVFLSYAHDDEKFVSQEILPKLKSYTLHVQGRDWEVGGTIPTQIHRSVEESRRTLIILSENFVNSRWATEEFRTVYAQTANDKRTRAVVVLLNINKKQLDKDTKTFLSLSTYIKYDEIMFWDKLRFALPRSDSCSSVGKTVHGGKEQVIDLWKGQALNVIKNEDGKLINMAYVKDVV